MTCGIYMIKNKNTGQIYIGQSINIEKRWREHTYGHDSSNSYIDNAIQKHGNDMFLFSIIEELDNNSSLLDEREKYWISYYNSYKDKSHYNLTPGGDFSPMKDKEIAKKLSGKGNGMYGKTHSLETRKKMSENHADFSGKNHPMYGRKLSKKRRQEIGALHKGKKYSLEEKIKISKQRNTTGFFRVSAIKKQDKIIYCYQYYDDNDKRRKISSYDLSKLEKKVKAKGLLWRKISE